MLYLSILHAKLPVISTNVGGCKELVKNKKNGILVPKNDPKQLSKAILFIYTKIKYYEKNMD